MGLATRGSRAAGAAAHARCRRRQAQTHATELCCSPAARAHESSSSTSSCPAAAAARARPAASRFLRPAAGWRLPLQGRSARVCVCAPCAARFPAVLCVCVVHACVPCTRAPPHEMGSVAMKAGQKQIERAVRACTVAMVWGMTDCALAWVAVVGCVFLVRGTAHNPWSVVGLPLGSGGRRSVAGVAPAGAVPSAPMRCGVWFLFCHLSAPVLFVGGRLFWRAPRGGALLPPFRSACVFQSVPHGRCAPRSLASAAKFACANMYMCRQLYLRIAERPRLCAR